MPEIKKPTFMGFGPPFFGGPQGVMSRQVDEVLIKNNITAIIMTVPGERVYRPEFGTRLQLIPFETLVDTDLDALAQEISDAITGNDERVDVNGVTCELINDDQTLKIVVSVSLVNRPLTKYAVEVLYQRPGGYSETGPFTLR
jgi:phage baseplate assembly protein W